jgi:hypothetical protein
MSDHCLQPLTKIPAAHPLRSIVGRVLEPAWSVRGLRAAALGRNQEHRLSLMTIRCGRCRSIFAVPHTVSVQMPPPCPGRARQALTLCSDHRRSPIIRASSHSAWQRGTDRFINETVVI